MEATIFQSHLSISPFVSANRNSPGTKGYIKNTFRNPSGEQTTTKSEPNPGPSCLCVNLDTFEASFTWMEMKMLIVSNRWQFFFFFPPFPYFQIFNNKPFNNYFFNL